MMDKNVLDYVVEKTNDLMGAPSCSGEGLARCGWNGPGSGRNQEVCGGTGSGYYAD